MAVPAARNVRVAIARRGITLTEFASRVGLSPSHLSAVLNGRAPMSRLVQRAIRNTVDEIERESTALESEEIVPVVA